jgi:hypothetical protein
MIAARHSGIVSVCMLNGNHKFKKRNQKFNTIRKFLMPHQHFEIGIKIGISILGTRLAIQREREEGGREGGGEGGTEGGGERETGESTRTHAHARRYYCDIKAVRRLYEGCMNGVLRAY